MSGVKLTFIFSLGAISNSPLPLKRLYESRAPMAGETMVFNSEPETMKFKALFFVVCLGFAPQSFRSRGEVTKTESVGSSTCKRAMGHTEVHQRGEIPWQKLWEKWSKRVDEKVCADESF